MTANELRFALTASMAAEFEQRAAIGLAQAAGRFRSLWFDTPEGAFVTSTAFAKSYPSWAVGVGDAEAIKQLRATPWKALDEEWLARSSKVKDDAPGEGDLEGLGTTFPHPIKTSAAFRATPASDVAITKLALAAVEAEWRADRPTLVLLSFTANDVVSTWKLLVDPTFPAISVAGYDRIERIDAPDPLTAVVVFKGPYAPFLELLPYVLPAHLIAKGDAGSAEWNRAPVGTGPYTFGRWSSGERLSATAA